LVKGSELNGVDFDLMGIFGAEEMQGLRRELKVLFGFLIPDANQEEVMTRQAQPGNSLRKQFGVLLGEEEIGKQDEEAATFEAVSDLVESLG
jgi:hypothetical protein